jgi:two-component sensor histidine kinase
MNVFVFLSLVTMLLYIQAGVYVLFNLPSSRARNLFVAISLGLFLHALFYFVSPSLDDLQQVIWLDRLASLGWLTFPVLVAEFLYTISRSRNKLFRGIILFLLVPYALVGLVGFWVAPTAIKEFFKEGGVWYFAVGTENWWFPSFVLYLLVVVGVSLAILLEWRHKELVNRDKIKANLLFGALLLFFLASAITNLAFPFFGDTTLPPLSYVNSLPFGFAMFYSLVSLREKSFSPDVVSNLISNRISEFVFYMDRNGNIYAANKFCLDNLKYNTYELQRLRPEKIFSDYDRISAYFEQAHETPFSPEFRMDIYTRIGTPIPVMLSMVKIVDRFNTFVGMVLIGVDYRQKIKLKDEVAERMRNEKILSKIREDLELMVERRTQELFEASERLRKEIIERKRAEQQIKADLEEKVELVKEIHHRVKNNIQMIISLINMLGSHKAMVAEATETLRGIAERVRSISSIHENFYASGNLSRINFSHFLKNSTGEIYRAYRGRHNVIFRLNVGEEYLGIDQAIPCGIIYYELLGNALKHAFPSGDGNTSLAAFFTISVEFYRRDNEYTLIVSDNGVGMADKFNLLQSRSTGFQLISVLIKYHLKGKIVARNSFGTLFILKFSA